MEKEIKGHKPRVKWPKAVEKKKWEINNDLVEILGWQVGTAAEKARKDGRLNLQLWRRVLWSD